MPSSPQPSTNLSTTSPVRRGPNGGVDGGVDGGHASPSRFSAHAHRVWALKRANSATALIPKSWEKTIKTIAACAVWTGDTGLLFAETKACVLIAFGTPSRSRKNSPNRGKRLIHAPTIQHVPHLLDNPEISAPGLPVRTKKPARRTGGFHFAAGWWPAAASGCQAVTPLATSAYSSI